MMNNNFTYNGKEYPFKFHEPNWLERFRLDTFYHLQVGGLPNEDVKIFYKQLGRGDKAKLFLYFII